MTRSTIADQFVILTLTNQVSQAKIEALDARLALHELRDQHARLLQDVDRLTKLIGTVMP